MLTAAALAVVAVTFSISAATKLADLPAFRASLPKTHGIQALRAGVLAPLAVSAEAGVALLAAVGLFAAPVAVVGLACSVALLAVLTGALAGMIRRGVTESCHCFGASAAPPGRIDLVRNGILLMVSGGGLVAASVTRAAGFVAAGAGVVIGATVALLLVNLAELAWLVSPVSPTEQGLTR